MSTPPRAPLTPVYAFTAAGQSIELHAGNIEIDDDNSPGTIYLWLGPKPEIRWTRATGAPEPAETTLIIERPGFGRVHISAFTTDTAGKGELWNVSTWTTRLELTRVVAHWANMPSLRPTEPLINTRSKWAGRTTIDAAGWLLTLDARVDLSAALDSAKDLGSSVMTHVGELRRSDNGPFTVHDAESALTGFQLGLSFALGRWVAPMLPVGFSSINEPVWEQWANWRTDRPTGFQSWWEGGTNAELREVVALFMEAWTDPARCDVARQLAHTAIAANHSSTTVEARIMLAQSGLEYLWWVNHMLPADVASKKQANSKWHKRLRQLLAEAKVDGTVPHSLTGLATFASQQSSIDGPHALAALRNKLVHPKDAGEPYRIRSLVSDGWRLTMQYLDLAFLHWLGYSGSYGSRVTGRSSWERDPVPWTA